MPNAAQQTQIPVRPAAFLAVIVLVAATTASRASCGLAERLADMHQAYTDIVEGHGTPREKIGRYLLDRALAGRGFTAFENDLAAGGFFDDLSRIRPSIRALQGLADGGAHVLPRNPSHRANLDALASALRDTGCFVAPAPLRPEETRIPARSGDETPVLMAWIKHARGVLDMAAHSQNAHAALAAGIALTTILGGVGLNAFRRKSSNRRAAVPFGRPLQVITSDGLQHTVRPISLSPTEISLVRLQGISAATLEDATLLLGGRPHAITPAWESGYLLGARFLAPLPPEVVAELTANEGSGDPVQKQTAPGVQALSENG